MIKLWETDLEFMSLLPEIQSHTIVNQLRCYMIWQLAKSAGNQYPAIEVGVYRGGTSRLISSINPYLYAFDTFTGMPKIDKLKDLHREGDFSDTSYEEVCTYLKDREHTKVIKGKFPESGLKILENNHFSFAHIDVDIYSSVRESCEHIWPRMLPYGIMVFDDYGFESCPGAKMAVDEFFMDKPQKVIYLPTGQAFVVK